MPELKYQSVREALEAAIVSGQYVAGDQLPAEQDIARSYNVSFMTARRAVSELVAADILERRSRRGTFVRHRTVSRISKPTVNWIATLYDGPFHVKMLNHCLSACERRGWHANVVRLAADQQDAAVRIIESGGYAIISLDDVREGSALGRALRSGSDRVVSLSPDLSKIGVTTIMADEAGSILMALERLKQAGHERIAIAAQFSGDENDPEHLVAWQRLFLETYRSIGLDIPLIRACAPLGHSPAEGAYVAVQEFLAANNDVTAIVAMGDELTVGVLAGCRDCGKPCPDKTSVLCLYDSSLMRFAVPAVTSVDSDLGGQMGVAVDILSAKMAGRDSGPLIRHTHTKIIERASVGPPNGRSS
ncbi:MAG: LacI family DNA-binding transcriptional regulator [Capsulimonadaceae bacterium]|nr:LacI family DNA-binding transcriptional regulator [Capsulimonadaceae bacterium]